MWVKTLIAIVLLHSVLSFDMWKIIEDSNKKMKEKEDRMFKLSDDTGAHLVDGDIMKQSSPTQSAESQDPMFDWHRRLWVTREIPYVLVPFARGKDRATILNSFKDLSEKYVLRFVQNMRPIRIGYHSSKGLGATRVWEENIGRTYQLKFHLVKIVCTNR